MAGMLLIYEFSNLLQRSKNSTKDILAEAGKHSNYAEQALFDKVCVAYMLVCKGRHQETFTLCRVLHSTVPGGSASRDVQCVNILSDSSGPWFCFGDFTPIFQHLRAPQ